DTPSRSSACTLDKTETSLSVLRPIVQKIISQPAESPCALSSQEWRSRLLKCNRLWIALFALIPKTVTHPTRPNPAYPAWRGRRRRAKLENRKSRLRQVSSWFVAVRILANWTGG